MNHLFVAALERAQECSVIVASSGAIPLALVGKAALVVHAYRAVRGVPHMPRGYVPSGR